ncbi:UNVERIFIED_ORG: uncharacterized protein (TIGR01655 family) [Heyndrickxia coagulans]
MKKILLVLTLILGNSLFLGACSSLEPDNPKGKTMYYTEITDTGKKDNDGRYEYKQNAYNEKGEEKKLEFSADKQLKKGAYIQLYYANFFGVRHWQEVTFKELPEAVQKSIQKNKSA